MKNMKIDANGTEIRVMGDVVNEKAYISLTDIAKYKNPDNAFIVVANWMRNHSTISFLGLWEQIHNPNFKPIEFDRFKAESGDNAFTLTPQQWIKATGAIGIVSKSGRYGGTYAHTDNAFEFASWISPEFKLYIIKDYQRLKKDEADRLAIWMGRKERTFKNKLSYPWARILAGEINNPSFFSLRTIDVLRNMRKSDAELFLKFCKFSFDKCASEIFYRIMRNI